MKNLFLFIISLFPCIISCQNCDDKFYVIIEDAAGVAKIHLQGYLCDDTVFCMNNESKKLLESTKCLDGGLAVLCDENNYARCQLYIVGVYEQDLSKMTDYSLYCDIDGCLSGMNDCIIFPNETKGLIRQILGN